MRKALVGLSTPLGYDYRREESKKRPNPVLDAPIGLFLFYDEIWFLDRRMCPYNVENLKYVHFLDEEYDISKMDLEMFWNDDAINKEIAPNLYQEAQEAYDKALKLNLGDNDMVDNHGRSFEIGKVSFSPNSTERNLMIDDFIAKQFNLDLITNSRTAILSKECVEEELKRQLTHLLICEDIPNFQLPDGPYHSFIEDLRTDSYLKQFRTKITNMCIEKDISQIEQLRNDMQKQINAFTNQVLLKHLSTNRIFKGSCDIVLGQIPVLSNIYSGLDGGRNVYNAVKTRQDNGWMGLVAKAKLAQQK